MRFANFRDGRYVCCPSPARRACLTTGPRKSINGEFTVASSSEEISCSVYEITVGCANHGSGDASETGESEHASGAHSQDAAEQAGRQNLPFDRFTVSQRRRGASPRNATLPVKCWAIRIRQRCNHFNLLCAPEENCLSPEAADIVRYKSGTERGQDMVHAGGEW